MNKINLRDLPVETWTSPKGVYASLDQDLSVALGREPASTDLRKRQPFDVAVYTVPAGKKNCPYHSHSAQWEFYHVLAGRGTVRHADGHTAVETGDAFVFGPDEPHQLIAAADEALTVLVVADNPIGESAYYPDSGKWMVRSPERRLVRSERLDYFDGEE